MYHYLMQLPDLFLFLVLSFTIIIFSFLTMLLVRWLVPSHVRLRDNSVLIGVSNLIGLIYGVLVGISALYLINNNSYTADAVQREANAVADVYRDSTFMPDPLKSQVINKLSQYLNSVIYVEWPMMQNGQRIGNLNEFLIHEMTSDVVKFRYTSDMQNTIAQNMIANLQNLYNAREQRIHMSYEFLNPDLWVVILIGAALTLFINYFYDMNFYLHLMALTAAALMTSAMLFLMIALDGPFQGEFSISPGALHAVVLLMKGG